MALTASRPIIDGDGHVLEDMAGINRYMPAKWQEANARRAGGIFPALDHLHNNLSTVPPGAFVNPGPDGWESFLEDVGVDTSVLYPTAGLAHGKNVDVDFAIATARAYNDWLYHTYTKTNPRLKGMALIPLQEPTAAIEELRRAVNELGFVGAMIPSTGLPLHLGAKPYWPIYEETARLGCALGVHGGCHSGLGLDTVNVFAAIHAMGHPTGIAVCFATMVINGIFDKFPKLRVGFLEGGVGWFIMALERLTGSYKAFRPVDPRGEYLELEPGESVADYIIRHIKAGRIYVGIEGDEPALAYAVKVAGNEAFVYSSDFPHEVNNETCKDEIEELMDNPDLSDDDKHAILHRNPARFYGLKAAVSAS